MMHDDDTQSLSHVLLNYHYEFIVGDKLAIVLYYNMYEIYSMWKCFNPRISVP